MFKKFFSILFLTVLSFSSFALPGFTNFIDDQNGEFVYYKDNTFTRECYIGILMYNDSAFQIRYYAPKTSNLPEKNLAIAVSINPKSNFWDMTGEKILSAKSNNPEDIQILNYLHDILYDFSSKRIKLNSNLEPKEQYGKTYLDSGIKSKQVYDQFGGDVEITFDCTVPLFNIKTIKNKNKIVLECVSFGIIKDANDKTFDDFKGINNSNRKTKSSTTFKTTKANLINNSVYKVNLDQNWTENDGGIFLLQQNGIMTISSMKYELPKNKNSKYIFYSILRKALYSNSGLYSLLNEAQISYKNSTIRLNFPVYTAPNEFIQEFKDINVTKSDINIMTFACDNPCYLSNKKYIDSVISSFEFLK